jgi:VanZ family protein
MLCNPRAHRGQHPGHAAAGLTRLQASTAGAVILLLAGLAIEIAQHFVPGRSFCIRDTAANAAGVLTGTVTGLAAAL